MLSLHVCVFYNYCSKGLKLIFLEKLAKFPTLRDFAGFGGATIANVITANGFASILRVLHMI